jgi:NhaP-type Na+/H+ or K+/H+ antiporter
MVFAAFMANIDMLSVIPQLQEKKFPNMHNLVKGQGLCADAISLLLVLAGEKRWANWIYDGQPQQTGWKAVGEMSMTFSVLLYGLSVSVAVGLFIGTITCLCLKHIRSITVSVVHEITFVLVMFFMAYSLGDLCKASGVVSLIVVAVMMRTYGYYNLSPKAKLITGQNVHTFGYFSEALVLVIVGLGLLEKGNSSWSW